MAQSRAEIGLAKSPVVDWARLPQLSNLVYTVVARDYRQADLFDGFQTANRTRAAESQLSGAGEARRVMEQTILLNAATARHGCAA